MSQETRTVTVRRAPKYLPFVLLGGVMGVLTGGIIYLVTGQASTKDWASMLGLLIVGPAALGVGAAIIVVSVLDRRSVAAAKRVEAAKLDG